MTTSTGTTPVFGYVLEEDRYVLYNRGVRVLATERVALLLDQHSGTLHKHGLPALVAADYQRMTKAFRAGGFPHLADGLIVIEGAFALDDLNACLTINGYVGKFYARLNARA
jgi:hypothetical protein